MIKHFVTVLIAALLSSSPLRAEPLSPRAFTDAFAAAVVKALPGARVVVIGELLTDTSIANGRPATSDLREAYERYLLAPSDLDAIFHEYVGVVVEGVRYPGPVPNRSRIIPILKSQQWLNGLRQQLQAGGSDKEVHMLSEPYNEELEIFYVEDRPSSLRFLTTDDDVGDRAKLRDLALANLRRVITKVVLHPGEDDIYIVEAGGHFESSLLLSDRMWTSGQIKVDGDIVAAVPIKETLLLTGSRNRAGLDRMRALVTEVLAAGPRLSNALFIYRDGKFVRFDD